MAIRAWRPVNEIKKNQDQNQDQYLYHYTTMEKHIAFFVRMNCGSLSLLRQMTFLNKK